MSHESLCRLWAIAAVGVVCWGASPSAASAEESRRRAALEYERRSGAQRCPDERIVRDGVAARLGYDPFVEEGQRRVRVIIRPKSEGAGYRARIEVRREGDSEPGVRELSTEDASCGRLARTLIFTTSLLIDPASAQRGRERPDAPRRAVMAAVLRVHDAVDRGDSVLRAVEESAADRENEASEPSGEASDDTASDPIDVRGSIGAGLAGGTAPTPSPVARLEVELAKREWSVRLGGRTEWPTTHDLEQGKLVTSLTVATLDLCGRLEPVFGCGTVSAGRLRLAGEEVLDARAVGRTYTAVGAGSGVDLWPGENLGLRLQGRLYATVNPTRTFVGDERVWTTPVLSGTISAAALFDF